MKEILRTPRLILRELTEEDLEDLREIHQDEETMTAYAHVFCEEEVRAWLLRNLDRYAQDGIGLWAVILRETGEFVGEVGLTWQKVEEESLLEVGYLLKRSCWHQGYATEAAKGCMAYAFRVLGADRVVSIIRDSNAASLQVARRNGMAERKTFVKHYWGQDMPHVVYELTRAEAEERFGRDFFLPDLDSAPGEGLE